MNIRRNIDYSEMFKTLDMLMAQQLPQMELYCEIGKSVSRRTEKGAAVAAAEYLSKQYPDVQGFSPRNLRRMRDFYRTYENHPTLRSLALQIGWTQNVVIMEADLSMEYRAWYLKAVRQFAWSKTELTEKIASNAHETIVLAIDEEVCLVVEQEKDKPNKTDSIPLEENRIRLQIQTIRYWVKSKEKGGRRWHVMLCPIFTGKRSVFMRC